MSGISAQQYLSHSAGIVVAQEQHPTGPKTVVRHSGAITCVYDDDYLGSNSYLVFKKHWQAFCEKHNVLREYPLQPAFVFLQSFKVGQVLSKLDIEKIDSVVLSQLEHTEGFDEDVAEFREATGESRISQMRRYDALFRVALRIREEGFPGVYHGVDVGEVLKPAEHLANLGKGKAFEVDTFITVLQAAFPAGKIAQLDGRDIFVTGGQGDVLSLFGGSQVEVTVGVPEQREVESGTTAAEEVQTASLSQAVDTCYKAGLLKTLARAFPMPHIKATGEERELLDFAAVNTIVGKNGIGKSAMRGMGKIAGQGTLEAAVDRVASHLSIKSADRYSGEEIYRLAASTVARMQSNKVLFSEDGVICIRDC